MTSFPGVGTPRIPGMANDESGGLCKGEAPESQLHFRPIALNFVHYLDIVDLGLVARIRKCSKENCLFTQPQMENIIENTHLY